MERTCSACVFCMEARKKAMPGPRSEVDMAFVHVESTGLQSQSTLPSAGKVTVARTPSAVFSRRHSAPCRSSIIFTRYSPRPLPPVARLREPSAR